MGIDNIHLEVARNQHRHEDRRRVHDHGAIVEPIAVAHEEVSVEVASLGDGAVSTVDECPHLICYITLLIRLDTENSISSLESR